MNCCPLLLLFILLFVIQIGFLPNVNATYGKRKAAAGAEVSHPHPIKINQSSVLKLLQCLVKYDYAQKAQPISTMPRKELGTEKEVKDYSKIEGAVEQMHYFMSAYFHAEDSVKKCVQEDKNLETLVTNAVSGSFIGKGKEWIEKEFSEIKTKSGYIYVNRGSTRPGEIFGTRSKPKDFPKGLRFWRRFPIPYGLAVKGSILESAKKLKEKAQIHPNEHVNWELQHIVDEIEADLLITKYTYHNYYVGDEKDFKERVKVEFTDNDGNKKLEWESIEAHEEKNLYFDRAYKMHREYIDNFMKNVNIVPDHGHQVALTIPKATRVFWVVRRLSAHKEDKDLSDDQIKLIKADLTNAFGHIPIRKINIIMVEYKNKEEIKETPENIKKFESIEKIKKTNERIAKDNKEGPGKAKIKNREAEITARHILGKRNSGKEKVEITQIGPMPEKKQYVQGKPFGAGDDEDIPSVIELMQIVAAKEQPVPMETDEKSKQKAAEDPMEIDEAEQHPSKASSSQGTAVHVTVGKSLLSIEEIENIADHPKSVEPKFNGKDWLAPGEEKLEHIVLIADLAAIMALQQLVDNKYKYAAPGCILKLVEVEGGSSDAQNELENGLEGLRLISGGIYKHLGTKVKDEAFLKTYFAN